MVRCVKVQTFRLGHPMANNTAATFREESARFEYMTAMCGLATVLITLPLRLTATPTSMRTLSFIHSLCELEHTLINRATPRHAAIEKRARGTPARGATPNFPRHRVG